METRNHIEHEGNQIRVQDEEIRSELEHLKRQKETRIDEQ